MLYLFLDWTENSKEDVYFKISCLRITDNFTYFVVK